MECADTASFLKASTLAISALVMYM